MDLGKRIKQLRVKSELTPTELARRAGVSVPTITKLEDGSAQNPTLDNLRAIASALEVTIAYLIGEGHPIPENLRRLALKNGIPYKDLDPLLLMNFENKENTTEEEWKHLISSFKDYPDLYKRMGRVKENGQTS